VIKLEITGKYGLNTVALGYKDFNIIEFPDFINNTQHMSHQEPLISVRSEDMQLDDWERPACIQLILQDAVNAL
jgi:hypothetical protein